MSKHSPSKIPSAGYLSTYKTLLRFLLMAVAVLTASRVFLSILHWDRIGWSALPPLFFGGLRIDLCLLGMLTAGPAFMAPFLAGTPAFRAFETYYYRIALLVIVFFELITSNFIEQYDTRPNRLFFEYLNHPEEVASMMIRGFAGVLVLVLLGMILSFFLVSRLIPHAKTSVLPLGKGILSSLLYGLLAFAAIRGTISHRPINPATVAFAADRMLNTLPLNSTYSLLYSLYRMKDEQHAGDLYGSMPEEQMHAIVRKSAQMPATPMDPNRPSMHAMKASTEHSTPPHVVIILQESLGARYVGHLGGKDLTPEIDSLASDAWDLRSLYATGTRSARGIEAVISGFLPTPARSVVKLGLSQSNFFTLANIFAANNYNTTFMYGGEGHFDNMRSFLLNNGFERIIDRPKFRNPVFLGSWGVSDEDMLNRLHEELSKAKKPQFFFTFTVTNHTPYEYPEGRIEPAPPKAATVDNAIRYADWAVGNFFRKARQSEYYENTIFLIVADHDSRVYGASLIPIEHFHIPGMFLGRGIQAKSDSRLVSQIDLAPTLLSLAGINDVHPMLGLDLTKTPDDFEGRAIMQYGDNYGYRKGNDIVVMQPKLPPQQFTVSEDDKLIESSLDPDLGREALAHALWPSWAYRNRRYPPYR